ncbi:MAG: hypothetical protein OEW65_11275, partial [Thermoleophilia bacterium]|nr:hypothetical protein [Thermoleophilia bacterium]
MAGEVAIRRATADDVEFLAGLVTDDEVAPFLAAVRPASPDEVLDEIRRSEADPGESGVFVIEVGGERAGTMAFRQVNKRSRIASLEG